MINAAQQENNGVQVHMHSATVHSAMGTAMQLYCSILSTLTGTAQSVADQGLCSCVPGGSLRLAESALL